METKPAITWCVRNTVTNKYLTGKNDKGRFTFGGQGSIERLIFTDKMEAKEVRKGLNDSYNGQERFDIGWVVCEIK